MRLGRLFEGRVGPHRVRRPGLVRAALQRTQADLLRLCRARPDRRAGRARRRHDRPDRGAWIAAVRAGDRDPLRRRAAASSPTSSATYGFADSFNPSFRYTDAKVETGTVDPHRGWVATDYLGIDQGPILLQAANYRDDFVWRHMRRVPAIRRGLKRAGFTGGWLG